jgi:hypothetical protein
MHRDSQEWDKRLQMLTQKTEKHQCRMEVASAMYVGKPHELSDCKASK